MLEKARQTPALEVVYLTVVDTNLAARRLYQSCGFREFGNEPLAIAEDGRYLGKIHLWQRLNADPAEAPPRGAPASFESARLKYRRLREDDLEAVLARYAADPEVTRYLSWPRHRSLADTRIFLELSDAQWAKGPAGPYLLEAEGRLIGSTGLEFPTPCRATVGYALARDAWGRGYATEALAAMVGIARELGAHRIETIVHPANGASVRVLEKGGFTREGLLRRHTIFPNLDPEIPADVLLFGQVLR